MCNCASCPNCTFSGSLNLAIWYKKHLYHGNWQIQTRFDLFFYLLSRLKKVIEKILIMQIRLYSVTSSYIVSSTKMRKDSSNIQKLVHNVAKKSLTSLINDGSLLFYSLMSMKKSSISHVETILHQLQP